ncbi:DMT family transporter [Pseudaminobacter salicylatoxidans]|uniref:DMT family transporter n=1 Tax=Pseudaminobacter salicylatoxidans TaxID=93369 RepID=UPI0003621CCB|nr:DMT family transporter [Pseudaminobacter salicylatoxidans]
MTTIVTSPSTTAASQRFALVALVAGAIMIGCSPIFVRLSEVGLLTTAFWRVALAMVPLLIWSGATSGREEARERPITMRDRLELAVPGFMLAGDLVAWHISLHMTSVANATLLANMAPIFVTLGGWLLFRTRISTVFLVGLALSLAGVMILKGGFGALGGGDTRGDGLAIIAAMFYAGYMLSLSRLRSRFSTLTTMLWTTASAGVFILPLALFFEIGFFPQTLFAWAILLGLAWMTHASGQGLIIYALAWLPPAFSSLTLLIQPVIAAILAWVVLGEQIGAMQAVGGIIVLIGILVARRG